MDFGLMAEAWCEDGLLVDVDFSLWPKAARCASSCYALASLATCICIGQTETLPIIRYRCATIYCFLLYVGNKWTLFLTCKSCVLRQRVGLTKFSVQTWVTWWTSALHQTYHCRSVFYMHNSLARVHSTALNIISLLHQSWCSCGSHVHRMLLLSLSGNHTH